MMAAAAMPLAAVARERPVPAPRWTYLLCDLLTDRPLAAVAMSGVSMDRRISAVGSFNGTIPIPNEQVAKPLRGIDPQTTALYALRDGEVWWGGIVWTWDPKASGRGGAQVDVQAASFESFLWRNELTRDMPSIAQRDQLSIARDLVQHLAAEPGGNIGITYGTELSGVLRDRTLYLASSSNTYGDLLDNLSRVEDGFEYTIETSGTRAARSKLLRLGYPTVAPELSAAPMFAASRILDWSEPRDGTRGATWFRARGSTVQDDPALAENQEPLMSATFKADDLLAAGWPRLTRTVDRSSVTQQETLDKWARRTRDTDAGPKRLFTADVNVVGADWSPGLLGAAHRFRLDDPWHGGTEVVRRVVGCRISPPERGQAERVSLEFEDVEVQ